MGLKSASEGLDWSDSTDFPLWRDMGMVQGQIERWAMDLASPIAASLRNHAATLSGPADRCKTNVINDDTIFHNR